MVTEGTARREDRPGDGSDDPGDDDASPPEGLLFSIYREYVGEPENTRDIYVGFGAFFGGIALGVVGLLLFLVSGAQPNGSDVFWQYRLAALVFTMLALPAVATSFVVLLPVGRRTLAASLAGAGVCVVGTLWLTQVYPYEWTSAGNDVTVLSTYAVGVVLLAASTGSALVAQYVDSVAIGTSAEPASAGTAESAAGESETGESVSDDQVASDIEEAMADSKLTWGGVDQQPNTERLKIDMPETPEIDASNAEATTETRSAGDNVDEAVDGLRQLQGGEQETARAESPDDQVNALTEFRRQQESESEDLETGVDTDEGLASRLREKFF